MRSDSLTNDDRTIILQIEKALAQQTASSLPADQKNDRQRVLNVGRSFLLSIFCAKLFESEHDVDRVVNRCDEERQQRKNLGQCHGYIPPFGQSLRGETCKSRPPGALFMETKPSGRELPPAFWTQRLAALQRQL